MTLVWQGKAETVNSDMLSSSADLKTDIARITIRALPRLRSCCPPELNKKCKGQKKPVDIWITNLQILLLRYWLV